MANHSTLTGADLHEIKGAAAATSGQIPVANGSGGAPFTTLAIPKVGWWDYNDLTTATTPIAITTASTDFELTNDGAGANTNKTYALSGITDIWNTTTNRFDFSGLDVGDTVDIRFDIEVTTSTVNTEVSMWLEFGVGGTPYRIPMLNDLNLKDSKVHKLLSYKGVYMGDTNTKDNPARLVIQSDKTDPTVKVNGWYVRAVTLD